MKFKNVLLAALPAVMLNLVSCTNDDVAPVKENVENIAILPYTTPTAYEFSRGESTTVDVADQKSRILMLTDIGTYITSGGTTALSSDKLSQMYANTNGQFTSDALANVDSSINLKDKTATSLDYFTGGNSESIQVQSFFQSAFDDAVEASVSTETVAPGVAGKVSTTASGKTTVRLYAKNGIEPGQVVAKGMMGAHLMDQALNNFLSKAVLDAGNNRIDNANKVLVSGKNYTAMEHAWDQAYGYIYGGGLNSSGKTYFWENYIKQVNDQGTAFSTLDADIRNAFIKGRAAITGNDYAVRDQQIAIIKQAFSKIPAVRGVHYLVGEAKPNLTSGIGAFHALSEAYGFVMSLRYTNNPATNKPYFTKEEVDTMLSKLSTGTQENPGFWDVDNLGAKLDEISAQIAERFGFSVEDAKLGA